MAAFWHERLPLMPAMWLCARRLPGARLPRVHVLISRHRDGRFIAAVVRRFDIDVVHGSSSKGGAAGSRALLALLAGGGRVVITPDGRAGRDASPPPALAQLAALSGQRCCRSRRKPLEGGFCAAGIAWCFRCRSPVA